MKSIFKIGFIGTVLVGCAAFLLSSCTSAKALLPNVTGKAGEVLIVMDKDSWDGDLGTAVRDLLGGDCPYLMQKEPMYNLVNVAPTGFADILKLHRNIILFNIDPQATEEGTIYRSDVWASPQRVIQLSAYTPASMVDVFNDSSERILASLEQAERDRIIANSIRYEDASFKHYVSEMTGGSPHFPSGYKLKKATEDFIWIADEKQYTTQGIFVYKYPASKNENFTLESIIEHRNATLQANVPGMFENTYMTTTDYVPPTVEFLRFRGRHIAQTRGFWEVQGDFMGGPFVSHSFYSQDGQDIIVLEAWVYAPRYDKRLYLRQVESIIYSFEWDNPKKEEEEQEG